MTGALDLALSLDGRLVVCVGGGAVTARRVRRFVASGARVRVVAPVLHGSLRQLADAEALAWQPRAYAGPTDLDGAWLVHAATGVPDVDRRVAADAQARQTFCVCASDADLGTAEVLTSRSVPTPDGATVRVAVHGGRDPRRAASVADGLVADLAAGRHDLAPRRHSGDEPAESR